MASKRITITVNQATQFNRMRAQLFTIAKGYMTPKQLNANCKKLYDLSFPLALEMTYENIQQEAARTVKGIRYIKIN